MLRLGGQMRIPVPGGDLVVNTGVDVTVPGGWVVGAVASSTLVAVAVAPGRRVVAFSEGGAATPRRTRAVTDTNKGSTTGDASSTIEETDKEAIRRKRIASLDQSATSHEKFVGRGEGNRDDPVDVD